MKSLKYLFCIFLLIACKSNKEPDNLLPEDAMTQLLVDLHLLEAKVNVKSISNTDSSQFVFEHFKADVFKKNQTDTATFRKSYNYYVGKQETFLKIYKQVVLSIKEIDSLERENEKAKNQLEMYLKSQKERRSVKDFRKQEYQKHKSYMDRQYIYPYY
ncbi:MAG: DUF4296 domain-containing protein [Pseudarcicella sp.]|nr:DUF4296 domain-containing protein [Pseudarcicella sp.]